MSEEDRTSKYNEAGLQIQRLHNLWLKIGEVTRQGNADLISWKYLLDDVWRELIADVLNQADKDNIIKQNELLKKLIALSKTPEVLYYSLDKRHQFLKFLQDRVGKGGSYQDDSAEDMDR